MYLLPDHWEALQRDQAKDLPSAIPYSQQMLKKLMETDKKFCRARGLDKEAIAKVQDVTEDNATKRLSLQLRQIKTENEAERLRRSVESDVQKRVESQPDLEKLNLSIKSQGNNHVLGTGGISLLLSLKNVKVSDCCICDNLEHFERALMALSKSEFTGKKVFLINMDNHFSPVGVKKTGDKIDICIMDSTGLSLFDLLQSDIGWSPSMYVCRIYAKEVYYSLLNINRNLNGGLIYLFSPKRQRDFFSCSAFGLHDVKYFLRNDRFFEDLQERGKLVAYIDNPQLKFVSYLPPQHLKLAQFPKFLNTYIEENPQDAKKPPIEGKRCLADSVTYRSSVNGPVNMKPQDRMAKYHSLILDAISTKPQEELAELAKRFVSATE